MLCEVPSPAAEVEFDVQLVGRSVQTRECQTRRVKRERPEGGGVWGTVGDARTRSRRGGGRGGRGGRGGVAVLCPARSASFCETVLVLVHVGSVTGDGVCQLVATQRLELREGITALQKHVLERRGQVHLLVKREVPRPPVHDRRVASHRRDACTDGGELPGHVKT